jgi:uncharacterized protein (TIGR02646 family)
MTLGPASLRPLHRLILKRGIKKQDRILFVDGKLQWKDKNFKHVRDGLRVSLREQQGERCIFCRRIVLIERKNSAEDIEHFLDKSKPHYRKWAFSPVNLAIACSPCNIVKSTREMGDNAVVGAIAYTSGMGQFRWLHPYFDDYHENIEVKRGWIYEVRSTAPNPIGAKTLIEDLQLDKIETIEARATKIRDHIYRLTVLAGKMASRGNIGMVIKLLAVSKKFQDDTWADY